MCWFAIRSVYFCRIKADGLNVFEERIVGFEADDADVAHEKGFEESKQYAAANEFEVHDEQWSYEQDGDPLIDGYELWSQLFESPLPLAEFYERRYTACTYHAD